MSFNIYKPTGKGQLPSQSHNERINDPKLYLPSQELADAVNVALTLGQPLLLTGAPGTGKTQLAYHIAWFFGLEEPLVFNAQTTSVKRDLFYNYDALAHFQYSQTSKDVLTPDAVEKRFIQYEALGKAIVENKRVVVLIDEIDKAPRDLPNDVLSALENLAFTVPEIGKNYKAATAHRPIIIMTSNSEKNLPDAFLRRVSYYDIPFPDAATLLRILQSKTEGYTESELNTLIKYFEKIRKGRTVKMKKNPATAELIFWTMLLKEMNFPVAKLADTSQLDKKEKEQLDTSYSVLAKTKEDLNALKNKL